MKIDPQSPLPKYHQLKEIIKESSKKGMIKPNERIQSESELMTIYKISRHTVRHAMGDLVNEGWLYREPGIGTFCADRLSRTSKKTFIIGVISVVVSNYIFPSIIHGIDNVIHPKGYSIVLGNANHNTEKEAAHLQDMINRNVDGLIIEPTRSALSSPNIKYFHKLREKGIPFVMIDSYFDELNPSYVCMDDVLGGYLAAEYLLELGHRRISIIYKSDHLPSTKRFQGYKKALKRYKVDYSEELVKSFVLPENKNPTSPLIEELFKIKKPPTAIFCYNDQIALQAYKAITKLGLKIPHDVSLVGFDDSDLAILSEVPLTTVAHPKGKMGEKAGKMLLQLIESSSTSQVQQFVYKPRLIIRDSCKSMC